MREVRTDILILGGGVGGCAAAMAAGLLAAYCLEHQTRPRQVRSAPAHLRGYQDLLGRPGVQLFWPDEITHEHQQRLTTSVA